MAQHPRPERLALEAELDRRAAVAEFMYSKPRLTSLGRWTLLTRAPSNETEEDGFFEFGL
jgi:hypothetical protein